MSNYSTIYWLTRLENIKHLGGWMLGASIAFLIIWWVGFAMWSFEENDTKIKATKESWKWKRYLAFFTAILGSLVITFTPTRNEALVIFAGGKTLDYVSKDTSLGKLPFQATTYISELLDKEINDLKKETEKHQKQ